MDKENQRYKTVQQIIDERERKAPMYHAPRIYNDKCKPPESAWWHMRHRPYQRGGDAGENGNSGNDRDDGCERGSQGVEKRA